MKSTVEVFSEVSHILICREPMTAIFPPVREKMSLGRHPYSETQYLIPELSEYLTVERRVE